MQGWIKKIVMERGFGFIGQRNGGADLFFHFSDLAPDGNLVWSDQLKELEVEFSVVDSPKGQRAADVRPIR